MSRLIARCASVVVAMTLAVSAARAEDASRVGPSRSLVRWTYDTRIGYAFAFTTGQSFMGPSAGLAMGATLPARVHFGAGAMRYAGSIESGVARPTIFRSRQSSSTAYVTAGYDFMPYPALTIRPSLLAGGTLLSAKTQVGARTVRDVTPLAMAGPALAVLGRTRSFHFGVELEAAFVPARVAAPIVAGYALFGFQR